MTTLNNILSDADHVKFATNTGTKMHSLLQRITITNQSTDNDTEIITRIKSDPNILYFFGPNSRSEVPIAGTINGRFISRRIDRLVVDDKKQTVAILDYKTNTDRATMHDKYIAQIHEYATLLRAIYSDYKITGHILWTHDFSLENIPLK